jgi:hypothetical protein
LVAFIDILGFSQRVINIQSVADLRKLYKDVDYVQQQFEFQVKDQFEEDYRKMAEKEVLAFSDCLVISLGRERLRVSLWGQACLSAICSWGNSVVAIVSGLHIDKKSVLGVKV